MTLYTTPNNKTKTYKVDLSKATFEGYAQPWNNPVFNIDECPLPAEIFKTALKAYTDERGISLLVSPILKIELDDYNIHSWLIVDCKETDYPREYALYLTKQEADTLRAMIPHEGRRPA